MKRIYIILILFVVPILLFAQASGGQITRKPKENKSKVTRLHDRSNVVRTRVCDSCGRTLELYNFSKDNNRCNTCVQSEAEKKRKEEVRHQDEMRIKQEEAKKQYYKNVLSNLINKMVLVEGGTFAMGCRRNEVDETPTMNKCEKRFYKNARPIHDVTLKSYYISSTQVTQQEWELIMNDNPSTKKDAALPVYNVSWYSANEFISQLNNLTGMHFRLPTEAEWEYAARGGNKSKGYLFSGSNNLSAVSYVAYGYGDKNLFQKVASYLPNELGIYDMTGNGEEWCQDWYSDYTSKSQSNPTGPTSGTRKVTRGISAASLLGNNRIFSRSSSEPHREVYYTFRLAHDNK